MIYPVWPLFVTTVLKADMAVLGLVDGMGDAMVSISQGVSGYFSDRLHKRKVFIWTGYLCGFLSRIGYAVAPSWQALIPFRVLDRTGKMRGAPRDAMIADESTKDNRGSHFGLLRMADNLGAVCGILFCIAFWKILGYRNLFLVAAVPSVFAVALILSKIHETRPAQNKIYKGFNFKHLDGNFRLFLFLSTIFSLGVFSYSFLLIYAKEFGVAPGLIPVLYLIFTAVASLTSWPFGKLTDRVGRKSVLTMAFFLWGGVCGTLLLAKGVVASVLAFVLYGLHKGAMETAQKTFVSELAPTEFRASCLGTFQLFTGICALPSNLLAGMLWDNFGLFLPLILSLSLTAVAVILLIFVKERK